ncbi:MAG: hypothetical protein ACWGMZ_09305, partial [Thermoguttaceae bacterium]
MDNQHSLVQSLYGIVKTILILFSLVACAIILDLACNMLWFFVCWLFDANIQKSTESLFCSITTFLFFLVCIVYGCVQTRNLLVRSIFRWISSFFFVFLCGIINAITAVVYIRFLLPDNSKITDVLFGIITPMTALAGALFIHVMMDVDKNTKTAIFLKRAAFVLVSFCCLMALAGTLRCWLNYGLLPPSIVLNEHLLFPTPVCLSCFSQCALASYILFLLLKAKQSNDNKASPLIVAVPPKVCFAVICGFISGYTSVYYFHWLLRQDIPNGFADFLFGTIMFLAFSAGTMFAVVKTNLFINSMKAFLLERVAFILISVMCLLTFSAMIYSSWFYGILPISSTIDKSRLTLYALATIVGFSCFAQYALACYILYLLRCCQESNATQSFGKDFS